MKMTDIAYDKLKRSILTGELAPGQHLKESDLAAVLGLSRTPVREAIRRLAAERLVALRPSAGAVVRRYSRADLEEVFDLRGLLEPHAARHAALRASRAQLDRLGHLAAEMAALAGEGAMGELATRNSLFHDLIAEAADNARLRQTIQELIDIPRVRRTYVAYRQEQLARSMAQHEELVEALKARDPDWAASVMRCHIALGLRAATSGGGEDGAG